MSAQAVNVVSLDAFRDARNAQRSTRSTEAPFMMPGAAPIAWVPIRFVPVYWVAAPSTLN